MAKKKNKTNLLWLVIGALVSCALWGSAFPGIKIGYIVLGIGANDIGARLLFAGVRFFLAGILAIAIGSILHRRFLKPKAGSLGMIFHLSILQTVVQYFFFYMGLAYTTGIQGSIINAMSVFITLLLSVYIYKQEKMTTRKIVGCLAGFLGVLMVVLIGNTDPSSGELSLAVIGNLDKLALIGDLCVLISVTSGAISACRIKQYSRKEEPFVLSGYQFMLGGAILAITGYATGGRLNMETFKNTYYGISGWQILLHLALVSAVAYSVWGVLLKHYRVSQVAVFGFMTPVFGVLMSAYFLDESASISMDIVAIALILVSIGTIMCVCDDGKRIYPARRGAKRRR